MAKVIWRRFLKGLIGGAVGNAALVLGAQLTQPKTLAELSTWLMVVGVALFTGAISGGILALEKWWSYVPDDLAFLPEPTPDAS